MPEGGRKGSGRADLKDSVIEKQAAVMTADDLMQTQADIQQQNCLRRIYPRR
jgi:hypothetical protein